MTNDCIVLLKKWHSYCPEQIREQARPRNEQTQLKNIIIKNIIIVELNQKDTE